MFNFAPYNDDDEDYDDAPKKSGLYYRSTYYIQFVQKATITHSIA